MVVLVHAVLALLVGLAAAGEHHRSPILGHQSAIIHHDTTELPLSNVHAVQSNAILSVQGHPFSSNGMNITWQDVVDPTPDDLITLACDLYDGNPNDFFDAVSATGETAGVITLPALPDLRCAYVVRYVRASSSSSSKVGELLAEHKINHSFGLLPTQAHLSFTESDRLDEMLVIWVTRNNSPPPRVEWGLHPINLTSSAPSSSSTYSNTDMCNAPANETGLQKFIPPGFIHRSVMSPLPLETVIFYRVGSDEHGWSKVQSFTSRRPKNATSIKFLMYADQALPVLLFGPAWRLVQQVVDDIEAGYNAFLLHPGDLGYAEGTGFVWDFWSTLVEPITSRIPYMVTTGNHEYDHEGVHPDPSGAPPGGWHPHGSNPVPWGNLGDDSRGECGVPLAARFNGTGSANSTIVGSNGVFWYSFNEGPVHVVMLSSEHDWRQTSRQYAWLAADLASVNRDQTPWIVLGTHRMMYETETACDSDYALSLAFRQEVEPLLYKHRVNLMLVGHQHSYERSCPAFNGECVADGVSGTVHMVVGSAGARVQSGTFNRNNTKFSIKHANTYGYIRLDVNASRLRVEFVRTNAHDGIKAGQVWDSVELMPWK